MFKDNFVFLIKNADMYSLLVYDLNVVGINDYNWTSCTYFYIKITQPQYSKFVFWIDYSFIFRAYTIFFPINYVYGNIYIYTYIYIYKYN